MSIKATLFLFFRVSHSLDCGIKYQQMYTKGYASYNVSVEGIFEPDFYYVGFGTGIRGAFMVGNAYIQGNTVFDSTLVRFNFYKVFLPCFVDLSFYYIINIAFWKMTFESTFNAFKIYPIYVDEFHDY